ncbi:MAG: large conductance mechanosensitive channel protein MscL [Candidatus Methanoperedens sp.]|jgi:large conductance mechanosensitive channel|nr:large conductance mechanosensitive channel protein MscL [Candidatus Methanoperedens sp.]
MTEEKKSFMQEFMDFLNKYGVIGLAIAFVMGAAVTKLVAALVADLIMPIIGALIPGGDWRAATLTIGNVKFMVGDFVGALIDFIIIALVIFMIVKTIVKEKK